MPRLVGLLAWLMVAARLTGWGADPLDQWQWRNPLPNGNTLSQVLFVNGEFMAVGGGGSVATSLDGSHWTTRSCAPVDAAGTVYDLVSLAYGNGQYVVVGIGNAPGGGSSSGLLLTSPDGIRWTSQLVPDYIAWFSSIAFGDGGFVAVGPSSGTPSLYHIVTSPDGIYWTKAASVGETLGTVSYDHGLFFLPANDGSLSISTDGVHWMGEAQGAVLVGNVAYGANTFAFPAWPGILTSSDGETWTNGPGIANVGVASVTYGNGMFVAVGGNGAIITSLNAQKWNRRTSGTDETLNSVAYGNGVFVAVGNRAIMVSSNGADWQSLGSSGITTDLLLDVGYGDGRFVVVGAGGVVLGSADGIGWTNEAAVADAAYLYALAFGGGTFVATGNDGIIVRSTNSVDWVSAVSGTTSSLVDVCYGVGTFVAVGDQGMVLTSTNAIKWVAQDSGIIAILESVAYGNGIFVVSGDDGEVATSTDGSDWQLGNSGATLGFTKMAWGNGVFVGVGFTGGTFGSATNSILISTNGLDWNFITTAPKAAWLHGIRYDHGTFVAVGRAGTIMTSTNGVDWVSRNSGTGNGLSAVAYGNGTFVTVGDGGTILQSGQLAGTLLTLGPVTPLANGTVAVTVNGVLGDTWQIQASTNLVDWAPLTSVTITNVPMQFLDLGATNLSRRFYRGFNPN